MKDRRCEVCDGTGEVLGHHGPGGLFSILFADSDYNDPCPRCGGSGRVPDQ